MLHEGVVTGSDHFAHVLSLSAHDGSLLATSRVIASLLAPEGGRVVPFKGLLTGGVAHTTMIVSSVSKTDRHIFLVLIIINFINKYNK
jgi:hypothetical protein